jgi:hypothetical protein
VNETTPTEFTIVEIAKIMVGDSVLSIRDRLRLEPGKSLITFALATWGEGQTLEGSLQLHLPASLVKIWSYDILDRRFEVESFQHQYADPESGGALLRCIKLGRNPKEAWGPYKLQMVQSLAKKTSRGFEATDEQVNLLMAIGEPDARRLFQATYDYIRDWETVNFRRRQEASTIVLPLPGS